MEDITNKMAGLAVSPITRQHKELKTPNTLMKKIPRKPKKVWGLDDFEVGPLKGEGKYGKVHVARVKGVNLVYAMKVMRLEEIVPVQLERELSIHRELRHPHIVRLITWFTDEVHAYMIMEYCNNGTIYEKMYRHGNEGFPEPTAAKYTAQLTEAVHYLHSLTPPVLHRDVKPENTFLDQHDNLKLGDFGWSALMRNSEPRKTICGTLEYQAPELCKKESYGKALDAWTIGVFCFEMCYGKPPFEVPEGTPSHKLARKIERCSLVFPSTPVVSSAARNLMSNILRKGPEDRFTLPQILDHPWIQDNYYALRR
eukprot:TRINITY_DN6460_c0_g1_i1.p1 TRINITY_DN6460_c0_g1~~TRINITY_DN6460_c0_g1_i1.p1  ORF type:complete len:312 (+),score=65.75 TRINITY_DN6460_c0_g1_i1:494-1429(+)